MRDRGAVVVDGLIANSKTVYLELKDAETLIAKHGPESAVDRAHTALHGYLKALCNRKGLAPSPTASVPDLIGQLRKEVREPKNAVAHDELDKRLLGSISTALECINTIRNRGTLAHPNEMLLEGPEAMLFINCSRSVLAYLDAKLAEDARKA